MMKMMQHVILVCACFCVIRHGIHLLFLSTYFIVFVLSGVKYVIIATVLIIHPTNSFVLQGYKGIWRDLRSSPSTHSNYLESVSNICPFPSMNIYITSIITFECNPINFAYLPDSLHSFFSLIQPILMCLLLSS